MENGVCRLTLQSDEKELTAKDTWITVSGTSGRKKFRRHLPPAAATLLRLKPSAIRAVPQEDRPKGGTVAKASSTEVYAAYHAKGIPTGAYLGRPGSSISVWINPYCEANSNAPDFTSASIVIGRGCEVNVTGDRTWTSWMPGPGWSSTMRPARV